MAGKQASAREETQVPPFYTLESALRRRHCHSLPGARKRAPLDSTAAHCGTMTTLCGASAPPGGTKHATPAAEMTVPAGTPAPRE